MGWFSNLLGNFASRKHEAEEVNISNLYAWFEAKTEHIVKAKNEETGELINNFKDCLDEIKKKIEVLDNAELQNPNISPREMSFMTGNRDSYIKQINLLIQQMPEFGENFVEEFNDLLDVFSKKSHKNYVITAQFFKDQIESVASELAKTANLAGRMKFGDSCKKYLLVENIKKDINNLLDQKKRKESLEKNKNQMLDEIKSLNDKELLFQVKLEELEKSGEYRNYVHSSEMLGKFKNDLKYIEYYITELFSPLKRALRKYSKISMMHEKIIIKYEQDEIKSWLDDKTLKILIALNDMKKSVENMGFDTKEQIKILEKINLINGENLTAKREEHIKTTREIGLLNAEIARMKIIKDIENVKYDVKKNKEVISEKENLLNNAERNLSEIDIVSIEKEINEHIKKLLNADLKILWN